MYCTCTLLDLCHISSDKMVLILDSGAVLQILESNAMCHVCAYCSYYCKTAKLPTTHSRIITYHKNGHFSFSVACAPRPRVSGKSSPKYKFVLFYLLLVNNYLTLCSGHTCRCDTNGCVECTPLHDFILHILWVT